MQSFGKQCFKLYFSILIKKIKEIFKIIWDYYGRNGIGALVVCCVCKVYSVKETLLIVSVLFICKIAAHRPPLPFPSFVGSQISLRCAGISFPFISCTRYSVNVDIQWLAYIHEL